MKVKNGFTHILIFLAVAVIIVAVFAIYLTKQGGGSVPFVGEQTAIVTEEDTSNPPVPAEVSESTDLGDIEAELDATITGSPDEEINAMETDASSL